MHHPRFPSSRALNNSDLFGIRLHGFPAFAHVADIIEQ